MILSACFYADKSHYPNIGETDWQVRNEVYWRCMAVLVVSARTFGKHDGRIVIFTNDRPSGDYAETFARHEVEFIELDFTYRPPPKYYHAFIGAFYLLDAINWAAKNLSKDETILFIDPDCLITESILPLAEIIRDSGLVAYDQKFPINYVGNGLSRNDIWKLEKIIFGDLPSASAPKWLGGELFGLRQDRAIALAKDLKFAWAESLLAFERGAMKFNTEEQILSAVVHARGYDYFDAGDGYIRRIWTTSVHRKYFDSDVALPIWHLPAEKKYGFKAAWNLMKDPRNSIFTEENYPRGKHLAKVMGLRGSLLREATYIARSTVSRIVNLLAGKINRYE